MPATYDDANLMVQLLRWGADIDLPNAIAQVLSDDFDADTADGDSPAVRTVLSFMETVGTFVNQGVLDRGLVDDLFWLEGIWSRLGTAAIKQREHLGEPRLFENIEKLASRN
jgi:hypothetical protein